MLSLTDTTTRSVNLNSKDTHCYINSMVTKYRHNNRNPNQFPVPCVGSLRKPLAKQKPQWTVYVDQAT